ncbi:hypothetical protein NQ315_012220 [Exocentrus adspersus]|uniref:Phospholipase A2-like domain-containing protein n=1 Tax=Exocentrus adspersus TaxID=1586481 RepID=A0AAV8VAG9_9CUCU|nr:hypothetical protein NQ315_012220 [Exocentrus adspersus]
MTVDRVRRPRKSERKGGSLVNSLINKLPLEIHLPGYQYCGPGTKLEKRLARGDPGKNPLDKLCKQHDVAYKDSNDLTSRHKADYSLELGAWDIVKSKDASVGEKASAWLVTNIMKLKRKLGMGCGQRPRAPTRRHKKKSTPRQRAKYVTFGGGITRNVRTALKNAGGNRLIQKNLTKAANIALAAARKSMKDVGGKRNVRTPRIIPVPKTGGILPILPILAGLSALGALAGGAAKVAKVVNDVQSGRKQLAEAQRHNNQMEAIALVSLIEMNSRNNSGDIATPQMDRESIRNMGQSLIAYSRLRTLTKMSRQQLANIPKEVIIACASNEIALVWEKLPDHLREDIDILKYQYCDGPNLRKIFCCYCKVSDVIIATDNEVFKPSKRRKLTHDNSRCSSR